MLKFIFLSSYYTLMMWFPDLFERFSQYSVLHPEGSAGVCEVSFALANSTISALEGAVSTHQVTLWVVTNKNAVL